MIYNSTLMHCSKHFGNFVNVRQLISVIAKTNPTNNYSYLTMLLQKSQTGPGKSSQPLSQSTKQILAGLTLSTTSFSPKIPHYQSSLISTPKFQPPLSCLFYTCLSFFTNDFETFQLSHHHLSNNPITIVFI